MFWMECPFLILRLTSLNLIAFLKREGWTSSKKWRSNPFGASPALFIRRGSVILYLIHFLKVFVIVILAAFLKGAG